MIGYEWTSVPGGNNLHRNILFRDNKDKADQIMPFSAWQSEDPEKLWAWMAEYEREDRRQVAGDPAQRQPLERPHVRTGRLRRQTADEGLRRAPRALRGAAGDDADQGRQRDAPIAVAERRVRQLRHRRLGVRQSDTGRQATRPRDDADQLPAHGLAARDDARAEAGREPVQVRLHRRHRCAQLAYRDRGRQLLRQAHRPGTEPDPLGTVSQNRASARRATTTITLPQATPRCGPWTTRARHCGTR